jgi:hypothetical protein
MLEQDALRAIAVVRDLMKSAALANTIQSLFSNALSVIA